MKLLSRILLASAASTLALTTLAQTAPTGPRGPGGGHGGQRGHGGPGRGPGAFIVRTLDADGNRELSGAELGNAPAMLRTLDLNGDGIVTRDELHPARPADATARPAKSHVPPTVRAGAPDRPQPPADGNQAGRPLSPVMLALDANADGELSTAEVANAAASLKALDLDQDGKLTAAELQPLPPAN